MKNEYNTRFGSGIVIPESKIIIWNYLPHF
jgi:hypothetical protein